MQRAFTAGSCSTNASKPPKNVRWWSNTSTVSESPSRCGNAPPAMTAPVSRSFAPGWLLRVVSTSQRGFAPCAASTMERVFVATAEQWSNTFRHTFHAACRSADVPRTVMKVPPAATRAPLGSADTTSQPSLPMMRRTTSVPASTQSSRVK